MNCRIKWKKLKKIQNELKTSDYNLIVRNHSRVAQNSQLYIYQTFFKCFLFNFLRHIQSVMQYVYSVVVAHNAKEHTNTRGIAFRLLRDHWSILFFLLFFVRKRINNEKTQKKEKEHTNNHLNVNVFLFYIVNNSFATDCSDHNDDGDTLTVCRFVAFGKR